MGILLVTTVHSFTQAITWGAHSHRTIEALEYYLDDILNAVSGERGYIITGNKDYLKAYYRGRNNVEKSLQTLEELTQDDPQLKAKITRLKQLSDQKIDQLAQAIRTYDQQGFQAAQEIVNLDSGDKRLELILSVLSEIEQAERKTLREREAKANLKIRESILFGAIFALLIISMLSLLYLLTHREMHRRFLAEKSLLASELRFKTIIDSNLVGIFFWDGQGNILEANNTFLNMLGYNKEDLYTQKMGLKNILPPKYSAHDIEIKQSIAKHQAVASIEKQYIRKDGSTVDVLVGFAALPESASSGVAFVLDISDKKRMQAELKDKEAEERFYRIADSAPVMLWMSDTEASCNYISQVWLEYTGQTREEVLGMGWSSALYPEDLDSALQLILSAMHAGKAFENIFRLKRADGQYRWFLNRGLPRFNEEHQNIGFVGCCVDITEQRQSELALRESEQRFSSTFEQAAIGMAHTDKDGHWLRLNQKYCDILGYTQEELLNLSFEDFISPSDLEKNSVLFDQLLSRTIDHYSIENRYLRKDGTSVWVNLTVSAVWEEAGNFVYAVAVAEDITNRKKMETALTNSLKELSDLKYAIDESSIVAITDNNGVITYVNDAFCKISKYSKKELIGQNHSIIRSDYHPKAFFKELWRTIRQGKVWRGEVKNKAKDGQYYWVNTTVVPFLDESGKPYQYISIRSDTTAEKKAEEALLQLTQSLENQVAERTSELTRTNVAMKQEIEGKERIERQLRDSLGREQLTSRLVQTISQSFDTHFILQKAAEEIGNFLLTDRCLIVYYEATSEGTQQRLSGQYIRSVGTRTVLEKDIPFDPIQELIDAPPKEAWHENILLDFTSPSAFPDFFKEYTNAYSVQSILAIDIRYRSKSYGRMILHQCTYQRTWTDQEKSFLEALMPQIGATLYQAELYHQEQKAKEESNSAKQEAEHANQQKSQILAFVSHDFKNPLNAILGYTSMLEQGIGGELAEKQQKYVHNILVSGRLLMTMVTNILDIARLEEGQLSFTPEWIPLEPFISDIKSIIQPLAAGKNIHFHLKVEKDLEGVEADPIHFRQIILNLLSNAIKYNRENGTVILSLFRSEDKRSIVLKVQDTGIGIAKEKLSEIFKQFYRVESLQSLQEEGSGLGLASVKRIVELHGGTLSVESTLDVGSVFTVRLPVDVLVTPSMNISD